MEQGRRKMRKNFKNEKGKEKNQKLKVVERMEKNWGLFLFFCFSLSGSDWNFQGVYKNGNFYREKPKISLGKNWEKWLCPSWKIFLLRPWLRELLWHFHSRDKRDCCFHWSKQQQTNCLPLHKHHHVSRVNRSIAVRSMLWGVLPQFGNCKWLSISKCDGLCTWLILALSFCC